MKEILEFIFKDVWHFIGICLLIPLRRKTEPNPSFVYFGARKRYLDSGNNQHVHAISIACT